MRTFTPLWSGIVNSSLWSEPDTVVKVFLTMLAVKDHNHVVSLDTYGIAQLAKKGELEVLEALKVLASPDTKRQIAQEFDGRRIQAVADGWLILNGAKYREMMSKQAKLERDRRAQKAYREKKKLKRGTPSPGENRFIAAEARGDRDFASRIASGEAL